MANSERGGQPGRHHRRKSRPNETAGARVRGILELHEGRPFNPASLMKLYGRMYPGAPLPSVPTVADLILEQGVDNARRYTGAEDPVTNYGDQPTRRVRRRR